MRLDELVVLPAAPRLEPGAATLTAEKSPKGGFDLRGGLLDRDLQSPHSGALSMAAPPGGVARYAGTLGDIRIYNRALPAPEVASLSPK